MYLNKMSLFVLLILAGGSLLGGCTSVPDLTRIPETSIEDRSAARKKFLEGREFLSLKMNAQALESFKDAIELDPGNASYYFAAGEINFSEERLDAAEKYFKSALQIDPRSKGVFRELGRLYMSKGMWKEAVQNFKKDIEISGTTFPHEVYNWLALSYYQLNQFENAEREWLTALNFRDNADIRYNLGIAYKSKKEYDKALKSFVAATHLNPEFVSAHFEAAIILHSKREWPGARQYFEEVIRLDPKGEMATLSRKYLNEMVK
jgi:tetratricopeptide (TPR) repeat protein